MMHIESKLSHKKSLGTATLHFLYVANGNLQSLASLQAGNQPVALEMQVCWNGRETPRKKYDLSTKLYPP